MAYLFYLEFKNDGFGKVQIDEPFGFNTISFDVMQKEKGHARDIQFNGGEQEFRFTWTRNHYLDKILFYNEIYGFESKVRLIIEIDGTNTILGDLDFSTSKTDNLEYFSCKVIQDSDYQTIKRLKSVKVDMFSSLDVNEEAITPLVPTNMFLKAKTTYQESKWIETPNNSLMTARGFINPCVQTDKSNIDITTTVSSVFLPRNTTVLLENFQLIEAASNLSNINIKIKGVSFTTSSDVNTVVEVYLWAGGVPQILEAKEGKNIDLKNDYTVNIPILNRGEKLSFFLSWKLKETYEPLTNPTATVNVASIEISVESTAYSTIVPTFRLVDVMNQVIKSISGLGINAPRFQAAGQFYDNRLFNGNLARGIITDKPFYVSLEDIEKSLVEMNGDYEINNSVFFGIEEDYYKPNEMWFFDTTQFSGMHITYNPKYSISQFNYKYSKYQSLKENESINSADTVHGETEWLVPNKMVENKKEITVEWIRDAFLISETQKKSFVLSKDTASQNDDDVFCIDTIANVDDYTIDEVSNLKHEYNTTTSRLILRCTEDINFVLLGIQIGSNFNISAPDKNAGNYTVNTVSPNELQLTRTSAGAIGSGNDGVRSTKYTYTILAATIPFINYTNEAFVTIDNLSGKDSYSNLRYSVKRNIDNYYNSYLATCNLYHKAKDITNTFYKNNGLCTTVYGGKTIVEDNKFTPGNPLLSPLLYNEMVFANVDFEDFLSIQSKLRLDRGYIRTIGNDGNPIKFFVKSMKYENLGKELTIVGEGKYDPINMTITKQDRIITINSETQLVKIVYEIKEDKLYVYDSNRQLLYSPVFYNKVSINGATTENLNIFKDWMKLI